MSDLLKNGIYIIENKTNKKVYIGSTMVTFGKRFKQHIAMLKLNKHSSKGLQNDFNQTGADGFIYLMLEEVNDISKIRNIERRWIEIIQPEYNVKLSIGKAINYTEEIRNKMSLGHGSKPFEAYKEDILVGNYGCQSVAARELNIPVADLQRVLIGKTRQAKGYRFKFVGEDFRYTSRVPAKKIERILNKKTNDIRKKNIENGTYKMPLMDPSREVKMRHSRGVFKGKLIVRKDDKIIGEFYSLQEASETLNLKKESISIVLTGLRNSLFGYTFVKETITKQQLREI